MKTDKNIQQQIESAITTNAMLEGSKINVAVQNGEAILTGHVDKFCKKELVKRIVKDVQGVVTVAERIRVDINDDARMTDREISAAIYEKFTKNFGSGQKTIMIIVKNGCVWLEGQLKWKYQKELAEECIACIDGIKSIENNIIVPESIGIAIDEKDVLAAIYGDLSITTDIKVEVVGHRVILKGFVENINQKNLVTRLVRAVPGVNEIENFLSINWMS